MPAADPHDLDRDLHGSEHATRDVGPGSVDLIVLREHRQRRHLDRWSAALELTPQSAILSASTSTRERMYETAAR